jgi:hypothetical protein
MEAIAFKYGPYMGFDQRNKPRWHGILPDGTKTSRARLVMMNHLHCKNIPKVFNIHHINGDTTDDRVENLQLMGKIAHLQHHMPKDRSRYGVSSSGERLEYQRAYRADPALRNKLLADRRMKYQTKPKDDPIYIQKNRDRAQEYYAKNKDKINHKAREKRRRENA